MAKNLIIVESPAKVKTIKKFLGKTYEVMASQGHVRDLPKSQMGIDVENDFEPKYITIRGKGDLLSNLRKEVKKADHIYLATDPDREGEAISWHLVSALKLEEKDTKRISFNEITKSAVTAALKAPREIDMDLVDAQQARRVLDRMVGYRISPVLWAKVKRGLSAGRVQSVALRMICDRESEIESFVPREYWTLDADFIPNGEKKSLAAKFYGKNDKKIDLDSKEAVDKILEEIAGKKPSVQDIKTSTRTRKAPLPFTTSTMQQEASKQLNFPIQKTMRIAQQLYEGVEIKGQGTVGLITYLRTDSTRIADEAVAASAEYIKSNFGDNYLGEIKESKKNAGKIQDAHEAIRPSDITRTPVVVKDSLSRDQFRLYQLIWKRFAASRMADALYENTQVKICVGDYVFTTSASKQIFDGFMSVYQQTDEDEEYKGTLKTEISLDSVLSLVDTKPEQHFTQPPAHYTEASLVKQLEEIGVGRPSTYAPTISTLLGRHYILKDGRNLHVTDIGQAVNGIMNDSFSTIVDENFTATLESLLDAVENGDIKWKEVVRNFYPDLDVAVKTAEQDLEKVKIQDEESDEVCELCGRRMVIKYGPHGRFLACPGFPECRNTKTLLEKIGVDCPKCGKSVVIRHTRKGRLYFGCEDAPECDFMSWNRPLPQKCPKCGSFMVAKGRIALCGNDECRYTCDIEQQEG